MRPRVASDSGLSSDSCETFDGDFCREDISHLLEKLCTRERIRYLEQQMTDISAARSAFAKQFLALNQAIERMTQTIGACAQVREQKLKALLQRIRNAKISEWERQLKVCLDAQEALSRLRRGAIADLQPTSNAYARSIGLIDSGRIELEGGVTPLLRQLDLLGEILSEGDSAEALSEKIVPKLIFGGPGENIGEFNRPWGVCCDATGRILVADRSNNRVQVFNEYGEFQFQFGESGSGPGQFDRPAGITVDRKFRIIVSDKDNHRVQVFSFNGYFVFSFGRRGTDPGLFQYPWGVAVDGEGNIAVSDTRNCRIQLFDDVGVFIKKCDFYEGICGLSRWVSPRGVVFRSDGTLMVTDFNNHCILLISHDLMKVTKWKGDDENVFRPQGIACDGRGAVAVVNSRNNRVQVLDEYGNLLRSFGRKGSGPGEFDCLQDVCFQANGDIVVTEFGNNRVQVF